MNEQWAEIILFNGKIATLDDRRFVAEAAAIRDGKFVAVGNDREIMRLFDERTNLIDLKKRTVIPGLNESHLHLIRGGLNYNLELRWDGVPSLADGLRMLREQALRTPPGQWVRVVGGWSEFQGGAGYARFRSRSIRPRAAESRRLARCGIHEGFAQSAGW